MPPLIPFAWSSAPPRDDTATLVCRSATEGTTTRSLHRLLFIQRHQVNVPNPKSRETVIIFDERSRNPISISTCGIRASNFQTRNKCRTHSVRNLPLSFSSPCLPRFHRQYRLSLSCLLYLYPPPLRALAASSYLDPQNAIDWPDLLVVCCNVPTFQVNNPHSQVFLRLCHCQNKCLSRL